MSAPLAQTTGNERNILLVSPPYTPYMPAWENLDIDSRRMVMVRVYKPAERLWVLEQGIKSAAFGVVIGWLSRGKPANDAQAANYGKVCRHA